MGEMERHNSTRYTCDEDNWGDFKIIQDTMGENCSKLYDFDDLVT